MFIRFWIGAILGAFAGMVFAVYADAAGPQAIYDKYEPMVVEVVGADGATGTGVRVYAPSGRIVILTNRHMCAHHTDGVITVGRSGEKPEIVPIIEASRKTDICVLSGGRATKAMHVATLYTYMQHVTVIGYPAGVLATTEGRLVNREVFRDEVYNDVFCAGYPKRGCKLTIFAVETDAEAHPGSSGSPMINDDGEVVGLVYAVNSNEDTPLTYGISLESLISFLAKY